MDAMLSHQPGKRAALFLCDFRRLCNITSRLGQHFLYVLALELSDQRVLFMTEAAQR